MKNIRVEAIKTVESIANKHLGQKGGEGYSFYYDPSLLVAIPREINRKELGLFEDSGLPFVGFDTWNAYEVSVLTERGLPVNGVLKIVISSLSKYHVESKSLKLYLNSFNMTILGKDTEETKKLLVETVTKDLSECLQTTVLVTFIPTLESRIFRTFENFGDLSSIINLDELEFKFLETPYRLLADPVLVNTHIKYKSDLLRSNCRVTHQPDWGDIYIYLKGERVPSAESLAKYIVSHRTVSHFHEEICEMVYMDLKREFKPDELMVACLYLRRGGIDINPIRASHGKLIPHFFYSSNLSIEKTRRQ